MRGGGSNPYSIFFRSVWQTPQLRTSSNSSPGPNCGVSIDSTITWPLPRYTAAFIEEGTDLLDWSGVAGKVDSTADKKFSQCPRRILRSSPEAEQFAQHPWMGQNVKNNFPTCDTSFRSPHFVQIYSERFFGQVRDRFDAKEGHRSVFGSLGHGKRFHIN